MNVNNIVTITTPTTHTTEGFSMSDLINESATPLPITAEMWALLNPVWKFVSMDEDGSIFLYAARPLRHEDEERNAWDWDSSDWDVGDDNFQSITDLFVLNTTGINWKTSLTQRPE